MADPRAPKVENALQVVTLVEMLTKACAEAGLGGVSHRSLKELEILAKARAGETALDWYREYRTYSIALEHTPRGEK